MRGPPPASSWNRVLVRIPNWVGDVVMATPALRALRRACPGARITAMGRSYVIPLLSGSPLVDDLWPIERRDERLWGGCLPLARRIRSARFDAAILLANSFTSALPVALGRVPLRAGYGGGGRSLLINAPAKDDLIRRGVRRPKPMPLFYQGVLDAAGIPSAGPAYELPPEPGDETQAERLVEQLSARSKGRPLVGLNPGARFGSSKLWDPVRFGELARRLSRAGFAVLLITGPGEEDLARAVRQAAGEGLAVPSGVVPLPVLRALARRLCVLVTNDTGPRHIAVAAGCPVVALVGPTFPEWTAWNLERSRVIRHAVPCGPCHLKTCPLDHACMDLITVDEVEAAVLDLAGPGGGPPPGGAGAERF